MSLLLYSVYPEGLCPGWNVTLKGEPTSEANRFDINFLCDKSEQIAFHFNPRITESELVCNSKLANKWGKEERTPFCPLEAEEPFQMEISSDEEYFHVFIDGNKTCQFRHRTDELNSITKLQVLNDINISSVEIAKKVFM
uniref:Galectin n=1 Tax=Callorhinchus milii TaxID=7868 RepID=A0A4W3JPY3_CALMI